MYTPKRSAGRIIRRNTLAALLLLAALLICSASHARAQTAATGAGGSGASNTAAAPGGQTSGGQETEKMGRAEATGYAYGQILFALGCPALVIYFIYKAFAKKRSSSG